jgi:hypothetical protein
MAAKANLILSHWILWIVLKNQILKRKKSAYTFEIKRFQNGHKIWIKLNIR